MLITMFELVERLLAIQSDEQYRSFLAEYELMTPYARENVRYLAENSALLHRSWLANYLGVDPYRKLPG